MTLPLHVQFPADQRLLIRKLTDLFRDYAQAINAAGSGGTLDGLSDVVITAPTAGQVLKYDGTEWFNDTVSGGGGNSVTVACDFGASFTDKAQTVVTGQAWVTANSEIVAQALTPSGTDPDEMRLLEFEPVISDLVAGDGFTVTLYSEPEAKGTYSVMCMGV
jgi:hypothetical protein